MAVLIGAAGCAHAPINRPLVPGQASSGYRFSAEENPDRRNDLMLLVFFSGGGMRAAAFSYGVMEALRETVVPAQGQGRPLLSQVTAFSAVSGGAFTAAYYCVNGERTFDTYEKSFLLRDVQSALLWRCFRPDNLIRLLSPYYGRSDLAAEYYDRRLFGHATFGDLSQRPARPYLVINATDLENGSRFAFSQNYFDLIGSDLGPYPVARAVAASSAVPVLLSPVTLCNYAAGDRRESFEPSESSELLAARFRQAVADVNFFEGAQRPHYLHLVDGGVSDNLGLRTVQEYTLLHGGLRGMLSGLRMDRVQKFAVLMVDASTQTDGKSGTSEAVPSVLQVLNDAGKILLTRSNYETTQLFDQSIRVWQHEIHRPNPSFDVYRIKVDFTCIGNPELRARCNQVGTGFRLRRADEAALRDAGRTALEENPEFRRLVKDLTRNPP
jgi:NTE family protein